MNLDVAGVGKPGAALVSPPGCCDIATSCIRREVEDVGVAPCGKDDGIRCVRRNFSGHQIADNNSACPFVHDDDIEQFLARMHVHVPSGDLLGEGRVRSQEKLLAGFSTAIEGSLDKDAAERTVGQLATILPSEGHSLGDCLIDDGG